jgi:hypothetical protein
MTLPIHVNRLLLDTALEVIEPERIYQSPGILCLVLPKRLVFTYRPDGRCFNSHKQRYLNVPTLQATSVSGWSLHLAAE